MKATTATTLCLVASAAGYLGGRGQNPGTVPAPTAAATRRSPDWEGLSKSPLWQVRYCIPNQIDCRDPAARAILERLITDEHRGVAQQACGIYLHNFVALDRDLIRTALTRGLLDPSNCHLGVSREAFETPDFWVSVLGTARDERTQAEGIRMIGLCGSSANTPGLDPILSVQSPYVLRELARAFYRLGDESRYLKATEALLSLPLQGGHYSSYFTATVDDIIQTHPDQARRAWQRIHEKLDTGNAEPAWIFPHIAQEARLP